MNVRPVLHSPSEMAAAWSAAAARVERYLQAHRVASPGKISRLTADVIAIARARRQPGVDPTVVAMETLEACMSAWFARLLPAEDSRPAQVLQRGRVALALGEVSARWPEHFLRDGAVPADLVRVMRAAELGRGPAIRLSHMVVPQSARSARSQAEAWYLWPFTRGAAVVQRVISVVGSAFAGGR
jgi:hypothetical protein